jgi:hypothetical protein
LVNGVGEHGRALLGLDSLPLRNELRTLYASFAFPGGKMLSKHSPGAPSVESISRLLRGETRNFLGERLLA